MANEVNTKLAGDTGFSLSMDDGAIKASEEGLENDPTEVDELDEGAPAGGDAPVSDNDDDGADRDDADTEEDGEELSDLGDFDPEAPEAYEERYRTEDGQLNMEVLSAEFFANGDGLNEGTYDYLASLGLDKNTVKEVERLKKAELDGANAATSQGDMELFTLAGGPEPLREALDWGKKGGYSKDQQAKFNKVMAGKDMDAKKEAVELLMARFGKAPKPRPTKQARDATKGGGKRQSTVKPFANRTEYRKAKAEAGENQAKRKAVAERLARSNFE